MNEQLQIITSFFH